MVAVRPNLLEPYLVFVIFHQLAHALDHRDPAGRPRHFDSVRWDSITMREIEADSLAYLALVGEPAGPPYPVITFDNVAGEADEHELTLIARHAVRRRGRVTGWKPLPFALRRYVATGTTREAIAQHALWTDEDVLRVVRSAILAHDVKHGRVAIGGHHRTLKDFAAALARFGGVVAGGAPELRRRGHRDMRRAGAYAHAVRGGAR